MTFNRIVTVIVADCAAVTMSAMPGLAGQATRALKPMAMAKAMPDSGMAAPGTRSGTAAPPRGHSAFSRTVELPGMGSPVRA